MSRLSVAITALPHAEGLDLPAYATLHAAGMDLCAAVVNDIVIAPCTRALVPTGLAIALPEGFEAQVRPRSGLALKHGLTVLNSPGTIDADYRGEVQVILCNLGAEPFTVTRGMRIAQMVVAAHARVEWQPVAELPSSARGAGGFGSTGTENAKKKWDNVNAKTLAAIGVLLLVSPSALALDEGAQKAAIAFYDLYMKLHSTGIPDEDELVQFKPLVSPALDRLLQAASAAEDDYEKKTDNDVPPLVEGDLFTSNFEGAGAYSVASCEAANSSDTASCKIALTFDGGDRPPKGPAVKWQDTVFLVMTPTGWKVDDIGYGGNYPFGNHGRLRQILPDVVKASKEDD